ncbi:M23 family metallopeptidase [Nocardia sp. MW-W600-9]
MGAVLMLLGLLLFAGVVEEGGCAPSAVQSGAASATGDARTMPMAEGSYTLTSGFGMRWGTNHQGQDFAAASKTPIYAVADGLVVRVGAASGFGIWVVIDHNIDGETVSSVYGHMFADDVRVEQGQNVRIGQLIAGVGYNGQTVPPGPDGAHLHLEIWTEGGRFGGGTAIDPMPWLLHGNADQSTSVATSSAVSPPTTSVSDAPVAGAGAAAGSELPEMPASIGLERGLQVDSIRLARTIVQRFPQVQKIYGQRGDDLPDHPSGRAIDIMIPDPTSGDGNALGDQIAASFSPTPLHCGSTI